LEKLSRCSNIYKGTGDSKGKKERGDKSGKKEGKVRDKGGKEVYVLVGKGS